MSYIDDSYNTLIDYQKNVNELQEAYISLNEARGDYKTTGDIAK